MFRTAKGVSSRRDEGREADIEAEEVAASVRSADVVNEGGRRAPPADPDAWSAASALSSVGEGGLGGSSWIINDSVWNGTGSKVILCASPSSSTYGYPTEAPSDVDLEGTATSHETRRSDGELSSADSSIDGSDDAGSELTALAARPVTPAVSSSVAALDGGTCPEEVVATAPNTLEDSMITPGLHTAHLAGMAFDGRTSSTPLTLAHYLASTLDPHASLPTSPVTSGKARSLSSMSTTSLASFPTDAMSDFSRVDSLSALGDLEDLASLSEDDASAGSGSGEQRGRSGAIATIRDSNVELVMPRLKAATVGRIPSSASSATSSERLEGARGGQARGKPKSLGQTAVAQPALRVLVVGSSATDLAAVEGLLHLRKGERKAPRGSRPNARSSPATSEESISDLLRNLSPASESSNDGKAQHQARLIIETLPDIDAASERVVKPFSDLRGILRPDIVTEENELVHKLLPTLLVQVTAVDVVLLLLRLTPGESLAQHVAMRYASVRRLSKLTTLIPVLCEKLGGDAASHLTQGDIDFWGLDTRDELASLRQKGGARVLSMDETQVDLPAVLRLAPLNNRVQQCYRRWAAPASIFEVSRPVYTRSGTALCGSRPSSSERRQSESVPSELPTRHSLSASSPSGGQSPLPSPPTGAIVQHIVPQRALTSSIWPLPATDTAPCVDPLHLPSLFRLMGISLAATFTRIRAGLSALLSAPNARSEVQGLRPVSQPANLSSPVSSHEADAETATLRSCLPTVFDGTRSPSPFIGCCKYRYAHGSPDSAGDQPPSTFSQMLRCKGLLIATCVFGIALFFS